MDLWALSDLELPWCIHVAATLRLAEHIQAGRSNINALAEASGADPDALLRLLRRLVSRGIFVEAQPGSFALNDIAHQFLSPGLGLGLDLDGIGGRMAHAWGTLLAAVRTGRCAYHERFGRSYWEDLDAHPDVAASFDALMGPDGHGAPDPDILPEEDDWTSVRTLVDVGGGTGALLAAIMQKRPHVQGTLVDLPRTVARAQGPFHKVAQSFFDPLPAGADVYLLSKVLDDWPDEEATLILQRCAEASRPSGRVMVLNGSGPGEPAPPELLMLVLVGGRSRTVDELAAMGASAGLALVRTARAPSGKFLLEFRPQ